MTTKGLRHMQIRENGVRENKNILDIQHVEGRRNPADIFSKEDKDQNHFITLRNSILHKPIDTSLTGITAKTVILTKIEKPIEMNAS